MAKILFLTGRFPHPLDKGDKLRAFHFLKALGARHKVHLVCLAEEPPDPADLDTVRSHCHELTVHIASRSERMLKLPFALLTGLPFQVQYFRSERLLRSIRRIFRTDPPDVVFCHLIRMAPYVPSGTRVRAVMDYMDCFSIGALREATWSTGVRRRLLRLEHGRLARYERKVWQLFDAHCIISPEDRQHMPIEDKSSLHIVPNGVDRTTFHPLDRAKRYDVLFTGHMGYPPNIAAALFTAAEVMPRLRLLKPDATLLIAGIGAPASIKALQSDMTHVVEHFEHIREAFAMSRVMAAPMQISIGLQNKILQAMAMRIPVVTTTQGNAAIGAMHEKELMVADDAQAIADAVFELLKDDGLAERLCDGGEDLVQRRFTWEQATRKLEHLLSP